MKKKVLGVLILATVMLSGCGNRQIIDTKFTFKKAVIVIGTEKITVDVDKWKDYEDSQIQITSTDGQTYLTHSANVLLLSK